MAVKSSYTKWTPLGWYNSLAVSAINKGLWGNVLATKSPMHTITKRCRLIFSTIIITKVLQKKVKNHILQILDLSSAFSSKPSPSSKNSSPVNSLAKSSIEAVRRRPLLANAILFPFSLASYG